MSFSLLVSYTPTTRWKSVYDILQLYNISCLTMTSLFPKPKASKGHKGVKNLVSKPSSHSTVSGCRDLPGCWNEECWLDNETRIEKPLFQMRGRGPTRWTHFALSSFFPAALKSIWSFISLNLILKNKQIKPAMIVSELSWIQGTEILVF